MSARLNGERFMNDEELLQQAANCPTVYLDGFGAYRNINGVLRCVGFILQSGAQLNLVISLVGADRANRETRRILDEGPIKGFTNWSGATLTH
jgi:hypothetical protein